MPDDLVTAAERLAREAHAGQVDKQGRDYADHHLAPIAALLAPFGPEAQAAGWLHDIIEDTTVTSEGLLKAGFPAPVVHAVLRVSRRHGESYDNLIQRACVDPLSRLVKLMDNWVNLSGIDGIEDEATRDRLHRKYTAARAVLLEACGLPASS